MKKHCNGDCNQGRSCDCGEPYPHLDNIIFVLALVFMVSGLGYLLGSWR